MFRRHKRLLALGSAAALLAVTGCGSSSKSSTGGNSSSNSTSNAASSASSGKYPPIPPGPIKVGISSSLSGPLAAYGNQSHTAFTKVTLQWFNQEYPNGIDGHPLQLDFQNDQGDPTAGVNAANQFIADKDAAVIHVSDIPAVASLQLAILNKAHVPTITYTSTDNLANVTQWPYNFGTDASDAESGHAAAQWIKTKGFKKIALLTDNVPVSVELFNDTMKALKAMGDNVQVVKQVSITPGAVDVSTPLAQLRQSNPDLVMTFVTEGFGPLWAGLHAANWSPTILTSGVYYDGYSSLGSLASNVFTPSQDCVMPNQTFPANVTQLMNNYANAVGTSSPNMLIYIHTDSIQLEILRWAIMKYNSDSPKAIKAAMESMSNQSFIWPGYFTYSYSPTNHFGLTGKLGATVCNAAPFVDGRLRIPTIAADAPTP